MIFLYDVHAQFNAFIADEYGWSRNQFADFMLAFAAERTVKGVLGFAAAGFRHFNAFVVSWTGYLECNRADVSQLQGSRTMGKAR